LSKVWNSWNGDADQCVTTLFKLIRCWNLFPEAPSVIYLRWDLVHARPRFQNQGIRGRFCVMPHRWMPFLLIKNLDNKNCFKFITYVRQSVTFPSSDTFNVHMYVCMHAIYSVTLHINISLHTRYIWRIRTRASDYLRKKQTWNLMKGNSIFSNTKKVRSKKKRNLCVNIRQAEHWNSHLNRAYRILRRSWVSRLNSSIISGRRYLGESARKTGQKRVKNGHWFCHMNLA
jgi:hypothetical protein